MHAPETTDELQRLWDEYVQAAQELKDVDTAAHNLEVAMLYNKADRCVAESIVAEAFNAYRAVRYADNPDRRIFKAKDFEKKCHTQQ